MLHWAMHMSPIDDENNLPVTVQILNSVMGIFAGDAKFCAAGIQPADNLCTALQLMRMISCCSGSAGFLQRSGMLLRCVHLLRHIMAACPVSGTVCIMCCGWCTASTFACAMPS